MKTLTGLTFAAALVLPLSAGAATTGWGVYTSAATNGNCPSFCRGGSEFNTAGGEFSTTASSQESTHGFGRASAALSGTDELPILKAEGIAGLGKNGRGYAFASQQYDYSGTGPLDVDLDYTLTGTVSDGASGYTNNTIGSSIAVILGDAIPFVTDFGTLIFEAIPFSPIGAGGPATVLGTDNLFIGDPATTSVNGSIEFSLEEGDSFFIVQTLSASAKNGTADAFSTLVSQFLDPVTGTALASTNFTAVTASTTTTAVPLPAGAWLLLSAMGGLAAATKRRRKA